MDWTELKFDWNQVRAFLATAQEGSFSAAARVLGLSQPTLGRQVAGLESALKVTLFERNTKGLTLTSTGEELLEQVQAMAAAATRLSLLASSHTQAIEGKIRITASDVYSAYLLAPILHELKRIAPRLRIEIIATNDLRDLIRREADVAIRHVRPTQSSLIAQKIRQDRAYFYAASNYLREHGVPESLEALRQHRFICFGNTQEAIRYLKGRGIELDGQNFGHSCANGMVAWELARQGLGIAVMSEAVALGFPEMQRIELKMDAIEFSTWLVTHRELHTSKKIRLVYDTMARILGTSKHSI